MRSRVLFAAAAIALLGFAPAPLPRKDRHRDDPGDVGGIWEFVLWESNGKHYPQYEEIHRLEITKGRVAFVWKEKGEDLRDAYEASLDPRASPPSFRWTQNGNARFVGSYRLRGGEMIIVMNGGGKVEERPTDFSGKPLYRFVLRRVRR